MFYPHFWFLDFLQDVWGAGYLMTYLPHQHLFNKVWINRGAFSMHGNPVCS